MHFCAKFGNMHFCAKFGKRLVKINASSGGDTILAPICKMEEGAPANFVFSSVLRKELAPPPPKKILLLFSTFT